MKLFEDPSDPRLLAVLLSCSLGIRKKSGGNGLEASMMDPQRLHPVDVQELQPLKQMMEAIRGLEATSDHRFFEDFSSMALWILAHGCSPQPPRHRVFIEEAWAAMENAALPSGPSQGESVGRFSIWLCHWPLIQLKSQGFCSHPVFMIESLPGFGASFWADRCQTNSWHEYTKTSPNGLTLKMPLLLIER